MFVYIRARFHSVLIGGNLTAQTTGHRRIGGGTLLPFPAPPPKRPGELACRLRKTKKTRKETTACWPTLLFTPKYSVEN